MDVHVVKSGDTLWKIAKKNFRTVEQIVACNEIENPDLIEAGQVLRIPPKTMISEYPMDCKDTPYFEYGVTYPKGHRFAGRPHPGIDFHCQYGHVFAIAPGVVKYIGNDPYGYGHYVLIEHRLAEDIPLWSLSAHLKSIFVDTGYVVKIGDLIGYEGHSGLGAGGINHLHFELKWTDELGLFNKLTPENLDNYYANPREILENGQFQFKQLWCWNCGRCQ